MKRIFAIVLLCLGLFSLTAQTVYENYKDGQVYVQADPKILKGLMGVNPRKIPLSAFPYLDNVLQTFQITRISRPFAEASDDALLPYVLRLEFSAVQKVDDLMAELRKLKQFRLVEKVPLMKTDATPNEGIPTHLSQINAANAWNIFNGNSNITVAIIDNAVMWTHADLVQNTYTNSLEIAGNNVDDDNNGYIDDRNGWDVADWDNNTIPTQVGMNHGTHCAGIAAGRTDNGIGIASIGWNIKMIPVKCQTDNGSTTMVSNGYEGIIYAAKAKARIISCSWGGSGFSSTEQAIVNYAWNKGCIVFASAGNANSSAQNYPGAYSNVFCVAAVNSSDVKSSYSNYGSWVDIAAPGDNINSTVPYTGATASYIQLSGTSMATPMVAGLAGLMLSKSPNMTRANVLNCLSSTAVNIYSLSGNASYVTNNQLGAGRIEAYAAMLCASTFSALPPVANFTAFPRVTCPSAPVQFNDSSLYIPTAWSWTFQSGTPATSTASNPIVTWSNPGTYSVAMSCSNSFGGSAVTTKTAYITVSGPIALPFAEGFEGTSFLPANWTARNIDNDNIFWQQRSNLGGFGTSTMCSMFDNYTFNAADERDEMRSPKFTFANVSSARLRFDVAYARYDATYSDTLEVRLSTNCGTSWTSIYTKGGTQLSTAGDNTSQFIPSTTQWRRDSIDISALTAGQGNVMFSFVNRGHWGQAIYLDNINLAFPSPSLQVNHPTSVCVNAPVQFTNTSLGTNNFAWSLPGANPSSSTGTNPAVTYSLPGTYTVLLQASNGSNTVSITRTVTVLAYPVLTVSSASICTGSSASLSASGAGSYSWISSGNVVGTGSLFTASPAANTNYTLSGLNGICTSTALTSISVTPGPTVTVLNQSICPNTTAVLTASGASSYSWSTGSTINTVTVSPASSAVYTVTGSNGSCSQTRTVSVTLYSLPVISTTVSPSTICTGGTVQISAAGAQSYSWNTGATNSSIIMAIATPTTFTVTGAGTNCQSSAVVSISPIAPPSVSIVSTHNATVCAGTNVTLTAFGANTYTWLPGGVTGQINATVMNISGTYTVVGGNAGCSRTQTVTVTVWPAINLSVSPTNPSVCAGQNLSLTASGANSFSWTGGVTSSVYTLSLPVSTTLNLIGYSNGCTATIAVPVTVHALAQVNVNTDPTKCNLQCNGSFTAGINSGTGPYTFSVLNSTCSQSICSNMCAGNYTLQVTDGKGCKVRNTFTITEPTALSSSLSANAPGCGNCSNGSITVVAAGGSPAYSYSWTPSVSTASTASNLQNGCYTVTVRDANACESRTFVCIETTTGLEERSGNNAIKIFPNPVRDQLIIEISESFEFEFFSATGQLLRTGIGGAGTSAVSVDDFATGIYLLKLKINQKEIFKKVIIE